LPRLVGTSDGDAGATTNPWHTEKRGRRASQPIATRSILCDSWIAVVAWKQVPRNKRADRWREGARNFLMDAGGMERKRS